MTLKKHALNKDFIWQNANGPFVLISDQQAQQWNQSGFFVLEDVLPADLITSVKAAIDPMEAKTNAFLRTIEDKRKFIARADEITFALHPVLKSETVK
ncbi:MAG: hypothetical protein P8I81_07650, partial [Pseudomonadales bacterium]|nr:hypothetical protein [Pseudomonadales bacterium]